MARGKSNKDFQKGFQNRKNGIFKKSDTFHRYYDGKIAVVVMGPDGKLEAYESRRGLLHSLTASPVPRESILGPDNFETVASRHATTPVPLESPPASTGGAVLDESATDSSSSSYFTCTSSSPDDSLASYTGQEGSISSRTSASMPSASVSTTSDDSKDEATGTLNAEVPEDLDFVHMPDMVLPSMFLPGGSLATSSPPWAGPLTDARIGCETIATADVEHVAPVPESLRRKRALISLANRCFD